MEIQRGNGLDTVLWNLPEEHIILNDSFYTIQATQLDKNDTFQIEWKLPRYVNNIRGIEPEIMDSLEITFEGRQFKVYKYISGIGIDDGVCFTYLEPSIGILIEKSVSWGTYLRLVKTGDDQIDKSVFLINERIIGNNNFFNK
ncbi:hypothetical protein [Fulvivirga ligni]|uniref:hypothetical protein n=1 Tax=Fulvivirga ligni TaxID=2904246 RepID=UPI001F2D41AB|nr:hypothetical protein [Fulvivirga ligni]UII22308.1 hypothetical protein LVD16_03570 [Fulvivirga ligni]